MNERMWSRLSSGPVRLRLFRALAALVLVLSLSGCVSADLTMAFRSRVSRGELQMLAASTSDRGWGFYSHPYLFRYPWNSVLARYYLEGDTSVSFSGRNRADGSAVSRDGGRTWATGATNLLAPEAFGPYYSGCHVLTGDGVILYQDRRAMWADMEGRVLRVTNVTYRSPVPVGVMAKYGVVRPDGAILLVADSWIKDEKGGRYTCIALVSTNGGTVFERRSTIATHADCAWGNEGPCEPTLCQTADGDLICIMRTGDKGQYNPRGANYTTPLLLSRSSDGGFTWKHERMLVCGVMPKLQPLSNGLLALAFGRPGNNVIFSSDGGRSWGGEVALSPADIPTTGYCDLVELAPGRLYAVYDMYGRDPSGIWLWEPKPCNGVFGMELRLRTW